MKARFEGLAGAAARRPWRTLALVLALALAGFGLALRMQTSAGADTFVSGSAPSARATADDHSHFGGDPVVILVRERLTNLVETGDLGIVSQLEACLAGQTLIADQSLGAFTTAPATATPYGGWRSPCGRLKRSRYVEVVYGPGTFLNRVAVNQQESALFAQLGQAVRRAEQSAYQAALGRHLSRGQAEAAAGAAGQAVYSQQVAQLEQLALQSGLSGPVRIDDLDFIRQVVFDPLRGVNQPKARFSYLFPTAGSALIQVRLRPWLDTAQQAAAIAWIRQAVRMPRFRLAYGGSYTVTGVPVVLNGLASAISGSIGLLLAVALAVMALTLLAVFRSRLRLLPLAIALAACAITFGLVSLLGGTLTMASIAVLPILIGLAVDYEIQFQSRVQEAAEARPPLSRAVVRAAGAGVPTLATAALATATGFLALQLSPVPMVRGFGLLLVVGVLVAFLCSLSAGAAAMSLAPGSRPRPPARLAGLLAALRDSLLVASLAGAGELVGELLRAPRRLLVRPGAPGGGRRAAIAHPAAVGQQAGRRLLGAGRAAAAAARAHPGRTLAVAVALAAAGWAAGTQTPVQSDVTKLVPASMPELRDLHTLERVTGVSGEIDVVVHSRDVATPRTIGWMLGYEDRLLGHYGYVEVRGCAHATLCPALSLPDLFCSGEQTAGACAASLTGAEIDSLLGAVPRYFSQAVITPNRREATLAFGIRLMPLARQQRVIEYMRRQLHTPPGISAQLAGLPVLAAQANAELSSPSRRLVMLLVGLLAVGLVLLAVFRRPARALAPMVPIVCATGWSALILFLIGIPLNPMSAAMGTLVIAVSTEFSVLLAERFRQERRAGHEPGQALARTYRSTGAAVLASGVTAIMGFAVLIVSDITMLREFGLVTLVDLTVSLGGVLVMLPAVLELSERGALAPRPHPRLTRRPRGLARLRRRARVA